MLDSYFHVEIDGVKYRLAESAEGAHYDKRRQPLRAQTQGIVSGESGKFHLREDLLEWSQTDWQGGEGLEKWSADSPSRYSYGHNIDPFIEPGKLVLARNYEVTQDSTGAADFADKVLLVAARGKLYAISWNGTAETPSVYLWDEAAEKWGAADTDVQTVSPEIHVASGQDKLWWTPIGASTGVFTYDGSSFAEWGTGLSVAGGAYGAVGGYVYFVYQDATDLSVYEVNMSGAPAVTTLYQLDSGASDSMKSSYATVGPNALYILSNPEANETTVQKITPTTSAAAGFGEEIFRMKGFVGRAIYYHMGLVFVVGTFNHTTADSKEWVVLYIDEVNSTFGVVTLFSDERTSDTPPLTTDAARGPVVNFMLPDSSDDWVVMAHNVITGGVAGTTKITEPQTTWDADAEAASLVMFGDELFWAGVDASGNPRVYRTVRDEYITATGVWESAVFDNEVIDEKILLSIELATDPLPANTQVVVKYQIDQDGTWLTAGTHDTDNATDAEFLISTDTTTRRYTNLQIRLELSSTVTSATPTVRHVRARSTVSEGVPTWNLLLEASDEDGQAQDRSWGGTKLITTIEAAGDTGDVVSFKDGYQDRLPNTYTEYDVVIDDYRTILDRPGEGLIWVLMREVV